MTRRTRPGSIQAVLQDVYDEVGGIKNAATDIGVSQSTLSFGTELSDERPGGLGLNYADRLCRMHTEAAVPLAQHFATLADGFFQPFTFDGTTADDITAVTREFSDVLAKHAEAHSNASSLPEDYTPQEAEHQIKEIDELMTAAARMRARMVEKAGREQ